MTHTMMTNHRTTPAKPEPHSTCGNRQSDSFSASHSQIDTWRLNRGSARTFSAAALMSEAEARGYRS
jgi:hypothetical protein